ncbi:UNVERIFIED_CONTAM: hypothetical protein K2H54_060816 [Gekko kuhli]
MPNGTPHPTAAIVPQGPEAGLIYTPYEYPYTLAPATSILEYPIEPSGVLGAVATKVRRHDMRVHPYQRIVTADRDEIYSIQLWNPWNKFNLVKNKGSLGIPGLLPVNTFE